MSEKKSEGGKRRQVDWIYLKYGIIGEILVFLILLVKVSSGFSIIGDIFDILIILVIPLAAVFFTVLSYFTYGEDYNKKLEGSGRG